MVTINPIQERLRLAGELDRRRQKQIDNQVEIINRLLDGKTYDEVFEATVVELSTVQVERDDLAARVKELEK